MTNLNSPWNWHSAYPAPAKINLFLHITGRRADAYHLLQSAFRFIDYADNLRFSPRNDGQIKRIQALPGVPAENDLTLRAARLLQASSNSSLAQQGVNIDLEKRLPMGGGLGGGSSDAATVLLALNHLWQLGLTRPELQAIGLRLGADVPVFIFGQNAFASGIGEKLQTLAMPPKYYVLLEPAVHVPTAAIFSAPELKRNSAPIEASDWTHDFGSNDLTPVACARFPEVAQAIQVLSTCGDARMSGSGACVFAAFDEQEKATAALQQVLPQLPAELHGRVVCGLNAHPLFNL